MTSAPSRPQMSPDVSNTDLWYTVCPVPTASGIAIARGDLDRAFDAYPDVALRPIRSDARRDVREAHYDQSQPNAFREGGNIPPIWARSAGRNLRLLGLSWIEHHQVVVARRDAGIAEAADLRGKRLGIVARPHDRVDYPRATSLHGYVNALATAGLTLDDVELVDLPITEPLVAGQPRPDTLSRSQFSVRTMRRNQGYELRALATGHVDAIYLAKQALDLADLLDAVEVVDIAAATEPAVRVNNITPVVLTVRGELLEERPDLVTEYVAQVLRTAEWSRRNPADAMRLIARDTGIAEELVRAAYTPDVVNQLGLSLDDHLVAMLENQKAFLFDHGFLEDDFDVADWIAHEPLAQARELLRGEGTPTGPAQ